MFERFTPRARTIVVLAQGEARQACAARISPQHLLSALLREPEGLGVRIIVNLGASPDLLREALGQRSATTAGLDESEVEVLRSIGIDAAEVVRRVEAELGTSLQDVERWSARHIPFDKGAKKVLELAVREAVGLGHKEIGTEHLLLGLVRDATGPVAAAFADVRITLPAVRAAVVEMLKPAP